MGILARLGLALTRWTERWIPDSWVIAVMLSLFVAVLAMTVGDASPASNRRRVTFRRHHGLLLYFSGVDAAV